MSPESSCPVGSGEDHLLALLLPRVVFDLLENFHFFLLLAAPQLVLCPSQIQSWDLSFQGNSRFFLDLQKRQTVSGKSQEHTDHEDFKLHQVFRMVSAAWSHRPWKSNPQPCPNPPHGVRVALTNPTVGGPGHCPKGRKILMICWDQLSSTKAIPPVRHHVGEPHLLLRRSTSQAHPLPFKTGYRKKS